MRERHLPRHRPSDSSAVERIALLRGPGVVGGLSLDGRPRRGERLRRLRTFGDENVRPTVGGLLINRASETQVFGRQKTNGAEGQFPRASWIA
jgi:hypothetical protein